MENFKEFCEEIVKDIQDAYAAAPTLEVAERLAAKFLYAQIQIGERLKDADLDARMKKTGLKSIKAAVYLQEATKGDKKPSDVLLGALVDQSKMVCQAQESLDRAEVLRNELDNYLNVTREAHIFFRGMAKGTFQ